MVPLTQTRSMTASGGFSGLSVTELRRLLQDRDLDYRDCIEKAELVGRLENAMSAGIMAKSLPEHDTGLLPEEDRTVSLFQKSSPSVVYIQTTQQVMESPFSMRALEVPQGTGSGFIWDDKGHVVTNYHVVESAIRRGGGVKITLEGHDAGVLNADLVGAEPSKDLAVLRIKTPTGYTLSPIKVGSSSELLVGQKVLAIGNPFGLDHTLTVGVVSALGREVKGAGGRPLKGCVQTDAAINPGNSGGPLLDSQGRLIGVNTAILSASGASAGIGFAIPVDTVRRIVNQIIRYGRVVRPSLGIHVGDDQMVNQVSTLRNLQIQGIMVVEVFPGSPAGAPIKGRPLRGLVRQRDGSLALGDVITAVNSTKVSKTEDLLCTIEECEVGSTVELTVVTVKRGGVKEEKVTVKLTEQTPSSKL